MAKQQIIVEKCELCRREGTKLFLKGARCEGPKCAFQRAGLSAWDAPVPPRQDLANIGVRFREKQRCKRTFGLREAQFRRFFDMAEETDRQHRREPVPASGTAAGQRPVPPGLGRFAPAGAPDDRPRPHLRQRRARQPAQLSRRSPNDVITPRPKNDIVSRCQGESRDNQGRAVALLAGGAGRTARGTRDRDAEGRANWPKASSLSSSWKSARGKDVCTLRLAL